MNLVISGLEILHFVQDDKKTGFAIISRVASQVYLAKFSVRAPQRRRLSIVRAPEFVPRKHAK
jgi:hypothetical protein